MREGGRFGERTPLTRDWKVTRSCDCVWAAKFEGKEAKDGMILCVGEILRRRFIRFAGIIVSTKKKKRITIINKETLMYLFGAID